MTKISEYPIITNPTEDDILIGTDVNSSDVTKNFSIGSIIDLIGDINQGPLGPQGNPGVQGIPGTPGAVGPAGLTWRGTWVSGTSYIANDAVSYNGASWFCILATSGTTTPNLATANWALLASQGAQGIQGVQGSTGPMGPMGPAGLPYTFWRAIINKTSVVRVLYDGIGFTSPTISNPFNGVVYVTKTGFFTSIDPNKLEFISTNLDNSGVVFVTLANQSDGVNPNNEFQVNIYDMTGGQSSTPSGNVTVEIRIYN